MKKYIIALALVASCPLCEAQSPVPLIPAPVPPTVTTQQAEAVTRIKGSIQQIRQQLVMCVNAISREINNNKDKLTPAQVLAGLDADNPGSSASLQQAQADLQALVNKYAPGSFQTTPPPVSTKLKQVPVPVPPAR